MTAKVSNGRNRKVETVYLVAKKGADFDVEMVNNAIQSIRQLPADAEPILRVPAIDGFTFQKKQFATEADEEDGRDIAFRVCEQLFAYGSRDSEKEPKAFSLPMGYLNVHITLATGEKRSEVKSTARGEVRYLNQLCLQTLSPDTSSFAEVIREGKKVSNAIFLARYFLVRAKPNAGKGPSAVERILALLESMRDRTIVNFPLDGYETSTPQPATLGDAKTMDAAGKQPGRVEAAVKELVYAFQMPDFQMTIDPRQSQAFSQSRLKAIFYELRRHLLRVNDDFIIVRNGMAEAKRVPERFAYFTTAKKPKKTGEGGTVVLHEKLGDELCIFDPNIFGHKVLAGFAEETPSMENIFRALDAWFYTYNYSLSRERYGVPRQQSKAIAQASAQSQPALAVPQSRSAAATNRPARADVSPALVPKADVNRATSPVAVSGRTAGPKAVLQRDGQIKPVVERPTDRYFNGGASKKEPVAEPVPKQVSQPAPETTPVKPVPEHGSYGNRGRRRR